MTGARGDRRGRRLASGAWRGSLPDRVLPVVVVLVAAAVLLAVATAGLSGDGRKPWFEEVGESAGIDYETTDEPTDMAGGAFVADYDRDGRPDLLLTGGPSPVLYHNEGGRFADSGALDGVDRWIKTALWFDHDADGWDDLLLLPRTGEPIFLENDAGSLTREEVGLDVTLDVASGATAADYDGDGCPDLFLYQVGDWRTRLPQRAINGSLEPDNGAPNYLFRGDCGSFERVEDAGIAGAHWSLAASFADLTGDGRPDIHVANDFNHDVVYRNRGDGSFERIELPGSNRHGMASATADVAGDETLDVFTTNIEYADPDDVRDVKGGLDVTNRGNTLFVHTEEGFVDRATDLGIRRGGWGWAGTFVDLDDDGDRELVHAVKDYVRLDEPGLTPVHTRPAFWERTDEGFDRRNASRLGFEPSDARGLAVLDYDGDGDRDLLVTDLDGRFQLYENTRGGDAVVVDVLPTPDATALGAVVEVTTTDGRTVRRTVTASANFLSQNPRAVHVGLGGAAVERVRVTWPDGHQVVLDDVGTASRIALGANGTVDGGG
jgi:hypothetical protein